MTMHFEIEKLRAEVADLRRQLAESQGGAQRTVYVVAQNAIEATGRTVDGHARRSSSWPKMCIPGDSMYTVTVRATLKETLTERKVSSAEDRT